MRRKTATMIGAGVLSAAVAGGVAYVAVQSVSTTPGSQVVVPAPSHDVGDDHGGSRHGGHDR